MIQGSNLMYSVISSLGEMSEIITAFIPTLSIHRKEGSCQSITGNNNKENV
jgi:hypothetical protein